MAELGVSLKYFSGEDCDYKEYRRWKQWAMNKMRVMDKLPKDARGSFIWTLLSGRALETVEHLSASDYQKEGGEDTIFELLDKVWPEKDKQDEMGENISEVFSLRAKEDETLRQWSARAREVFNRCSRMSGVSFPEEARGWILLNCSGMSSSDRAVILARAQGSLKFDEISQAMRSCYPDYVVKKKTVQPAHYCKVKVAPSSASSSTPSGSREHGAGTVELCQDIPEHFVCSAAVDLSESEVLLVSSPGYAVLDSGCGKTLIGLQTLAAFKKIWERHGVPCPAEYEEQNVFRFGNGQREVSTMSLDLPVMIAGRTGTVKTAIVQGRGPLSPVHETTAGSDGFST